MDSAVSTWCSQPQQLCRNLLREFSETHISARFQSHVVSHVSRPLFHVQHGFIPWKAVSVPLIVSSLSPLCLFLLTSLTYSLKWAWHASRCLTKVCVCGQCLGRWDLLWGTLISSKLKLVQGNTGQVSGTTCYTPWMHHSIGVRSAPSFMAQSFPYPGVPSHPWMLVPFWGSLRSSLNVPSAVPMCANLFF